MQKGTWLRDLKTREAVVVTSSDTLFAHYQNADVDGSVRLDRLKDEFIVLPGRPEDADYELPAEHRLHY